MKTSKISRRDTFAAVGAGSLALMALASRANAAEMGAVEKANVKAVDAFFKGWSDPGATGAKLAASLADNCVLRMEENKPPVTGKAAATAAFDAYLKDGMRFDIKTLETFAKGPVVANNRLDAIIKQGKAGDYFGVVGVLIMKDGKIVEWSDFLVPKAA